MIIILALLVPCRLILMTGDEMHNSGVQLKFPSDLQTAAGAVTAMFRWHITLGILPPELHSAASCQYNNNNNNIAPETTTNNHIIT